MVLPSFITTLGKTQKERDAARNAVICPVFTSRNAFIVSKRGVRIDRRLADSLTKAYIGRLSAAGNAFR